VTDWSLCGLLTALHDDVERRLATARTVLAHPVTKGDASERVWLELLQAYLPLRYRAERAHVVDSNGEFSDSIDAVVFDRQYSPFIFTFEEQLFVPAESVYAAFEAKQTINSDQVDYAQRKIASVRRLYRTSLPIPHAGGTYPPKSLAHILGGILTLDSDWRPPLGKPLVEALSTDPDNRLDLACVAAHGMFGFDDAGAVTVTLNGKPATAFLLELIARLQGSATVPMIDTRAYARWLVD
jgi:hypothetical protein